MRLHMIQYYNLPIDNVKYILYIEEPLEVRATTNADNDHTENAQLLTCVHVNIVY